MAKTKTEAQKKAEEMRKLAKELEQAKKDRKTKQIYKAISIGKGSRNNKWSTFIDHIEDGVVVKRECLVSNSGKMDALHKLKLYVVRQFLKGAQKVDWSKE